MFANLANKLWHNFSHFAQAANNTRWQSNIAMQYGPCIDGLPSENDGF